MEITFNPTLMPSWILADDKIIYSGKEIELSSVESIKHKVPGFLASNGVIQLFYSKGGFETLAYPKSQKEFGEKAARYIESYIKGEITAASQNAYDVLSALSDVQKKRLS